MTYFSLFNLREEPFSNSPDPTFFYQAPRHTRCLHKLEISIRLKRGLNVVLGEVGTGKTTLCRRLIRTLQADERIDAHLLLDPQFDTPREFLAVLTRMLCPTGFEFEDTEWRLKERVKNALFRRGVDQGKVVALIIDEGQKIREDCLEILRELLNYETNDAKLLQIVIFAQKEFNQVIAKHSNLADRINELLELGPLTRRETRQMIRHRVECAKDTFLAPELFTPAAYAMVHTVTGGYPRKVMRVCHKAMLALAQHGQGKITPRMIKECSQGIKQPKRGFNWAAAAVAAATLLFLGGGAALVLTPGLLEKTLQAVRGPHALEQGPVEDSASRVEPEQELVRTWFGPDQDQRRNGWFAAAAQDAGVGLEDESVAADGQDQDAILGTVVMNGDMTLAQLARRIYGPAAERGMDLLLFSNSHVTNPESIAAGTEITVPSLGPLAPSEIGDDYFVHVATLANLDQALAKVDELAAAGVEAGCMPVRRDRDQVVFAIVAMELFADESSAHEVLAAMPESLRRGARIVRGWDSGAVLLAQAGPRPSR